MLLVNLCYHCLVWFPTENVCYFSNSINSLHIAEWTQSIYHKNHTFFIIKYEELFCSVVTSTEMCLDYTVFELVESLFPWPSEIEIWLNVKPLEQNGCCWQRKKQSTKVYLKFSCKSYNKCAKNRWVRLYSVEIETIKLWNSLQ